MSSRLTEWMDDELVPMTQTDRDEITEKYLALIRSQSPRFYVEIQEESMPTHSYVFASQREGTIYFIAALPESVTYLNLLTSAVAAVHPDNFDWAAYAVDTVLDTFGTLYKKAH